MDWLAELIYAEKNLKNGDSCQKTRSPKDIAAKNILATHKTFVPKQFQKKPVSLSASFYLQE